MQDSIPLRDHNVRGNVNTTFGCLDLARVRLPSTPVPWPSLGLPRSLELLLLLTYPFSAAAEDASCPPASLASASLAPSVVTAAPPVLGLGLVGLGLGLLGLGLGLGLELGLG